MTLRIPFVRSEFIKNVSYQMAGTGIGQALPFAVTPVLTRLYTEKDFALYTSFFAVSSILAVATGGRYQLAILLPRKNSDAIKILTLSIYITVAFTAILVILSLVVAQSSYNTLGSAIFFVPVYVLFYGVWNALSYLSVRRKAFIQNAISKIFQSVLYVLAAIFLGQLNLVVFGLISSRIVGVIGSTFYLFRQSNLKIYFPKVAALKNVARTYDNYPKVSLLPALLDVMSVQGLVLVLTWFYSKDDLGYYGLTALVLSAPLGLIGTSFRDVFYQKIVSFIARNDTHACRRFFTYCALGLFAAGLPVSALLYFFGPEIFSVIFGERWTRAGEFASILSISFLVQLVVSPLSAVFNATNKITSASVWQTLYFISTFLTLGTCASVLRLEVDGLLIVYVIHELLLYTVYFVLQYQTLKRLT